MKSRRLDGSLAGRLGLSIIFFLFAFTTRADAEDLALRFFGHGVSTPDLDRVKIRVDDPNTSDPGPPADVGATDFTLEFWMKANAPDNTAAAVTCGENVNWIYGNIVFDRDRFNQDRKFGLSVAGGVIVFGVSGDGTGNLTVCGTTQVLDGHWHHVAVQRRRSDGQVSLFVDGVLEAQADGPDGDVSYPDDGVPGEDCSGPCTNSDPFLVIGAEKHDAGPAYPSFNGMIDEVRLSSVLRYGGNFVRPSSPFVSDADTVALYHFDEGPPGPCAGIVLDSSGAPGGPSDGECRYGGSTPAGPVYVAITPFDGSTSLTCNPTPLASCKQGAKSVLAVRRDPVNATRNKLVWKWLRGDATAADFADPVSGSAVYVLCIYDAVGGVSSLEAQAVPFEGSGWRQTGIVGYKYRDSSATSDGIETVLLKGKGPGRGKIVVRGGGAALPVPTPKGESLFAVENTVTVQLIKNDGKCWESSLSEVRRNTTEEFIGSAETY